MIWNAGRTRSDLVADAAPVRGAAGIALSRTDRSNGSASMPRMTRRGLLAGSAALLAAPALPRADEIKPKVTVISQWSAGSDGAAITRLGRGVRGAGRRLGTRPGARLHHRDDEQVARPDHRRRPTRGLAAQRSGDRRVVEDRRGGRSGRAGEGSRLRSRGPGGVGAAEQAVRPLDRPADPGLSHQHPVRVEKPPTRSAWKRCPPPGPSSTPSRRR